MEVIGPAEDSLTNEDVIRKYGSHISKLTQQAQDPFYESERVLLLNEARFQWLAVEKNMHFGVPAMTSSQYGSVLDFVPFDNLNNSDGQVTGPDVRLAFPVALISGDCWKFCAVMGSNSPRVKGVPDDVHDSDSVHSAHVADVNIRDLWTKNKIDRKWRTVAFHQYTTGPCYIRGIWNADAAKYGSSTEPEIDIVEGPEGPVPTVTGKREYANGDAEPCFYSLLDVSHPYEAKDLEHCGWFNLERLRSKWDLLRQYSGDEENPGPLEEYRDGNPPDDDRSAASTLAAEARESTATPSGTGRPLRPGFWRESLFWLQPEYYESITDPKIRKIFNDHYPKGFYVAKVGSVVCEIDNRRLTDEWTVARVNRGERIMERPLVADVIPVQRAIDDLIGMALETIQRAITMTIVSSDLLDRNALNTREAVAAEIILTSLPVDTDIGKRIFQIPPAHLSDQVRPLIQDLRALMQDIDGIRPELSGGGQPTQTFREAQQRKQQALAQLAPQAQAMEDAAADLARILVNLRSKYGSGTVKAENKSAYGSKTDVVDIAELQSAGWHAEADDQFPLTLADRRDSLYSMLKEFPPEVQQALSVLSPINIEEICELLQIPGFESSIQDQKEKTLSDIETLLQQQPMPAPPLPPGAPPQPAQPSMPIDPYDNHQLVAILSGAWLVANRKIKDGNPMGFSNVVAFWQAHTAAATPPPIPPPPPLHGSLGLTAKLEDFPSLTSEVLKAAGVTVPPPVPGPQPVPMGGPPPIGSPSATPPQGPLPPLPQGPQGPAPPPM